MQFLKLHFQILLTFFLLFAGTSQAQDVIWAMEVDTNSSGQYQILDIEVDKDSSVVIVGRFNDSLSIQGVTIYANGLVYISGFVCKISKTGTLEWLIQVDNNCRSVEHVTIDKQTGDIYIAGYYIYPISFNGFTLINMGMQMSTLIAKIKPNGNLLWIQGIPGLGNAHEIKRDGFGNLIFLGTNTGTCIIPNTTITLSTSPYLPPFTGGHIAEALIIKYDTSGSYKSHKVIQNGYDHTGNYSGSGTSLYGLYKYGSLGVDSKGGVVLGIIGYNKVTIDTNVIDFFEDYRQVTLSLDSNLDYKWSRLGYSAGNSFGSFPYTNVNQYYKIYTHDLVLDSLDRIWIVGAANSIYNSPLPFEDVVYLKGLDSLGNTFFTDSIHTQEDLNNLTTVCLDKSGGLYITGAEYQIYDSAFFQPHGIMPTRTAYLAKFNTNSLLWEWMIESKRISTNPIAMVRASALAVLDEHNIYWSGWFRDSTSIDDDTIACNNCSNRYGNFIAKIGRCEPLNVTISASDSTTFCSGQPIVLSADSNAPYTYSWYINDSLMIGQNNDSLWVNSPGDYYFVADSLGCFDTSSVINTQMLQSPNPQISAQQDLCFTDSTSYQVTVNPTGGSYSGLLDSTLSFVPNILGVGQHSFIYTIDSNTCQISDTLIVTIDSLAEVQLDSIPGICVGDTALHLGQFLSAQIGGFIGDSIINPQIQSAGTYYFQFGYENACSADTINFPVTISSLPNVSLDFSDTVCNNLGYYVLNGGQPIGGSYFGTFVDSGIFQLNQDTFGLFEVSYSFEDSIGCVASDTDLINIFPYTAADLILPSIYCSNRKLLELDSFAQPLGGQFFGDSVTLNRFNGYHLPDSHYVIGYSFQNSFGCIDSAYDSILIHQVNEASFDISYVVCEGTPNVEISNLSPIGGAFSSDSSISVIGDSLIETATLVSGTYRLMYGLTDSAGCFSADTNQFNVVLPQKAEMIFPIDTICDGVSYELSGGVPVGGFYSGQFVNDSSLLSQNFEGSTVVHYSFEDTNGCFSKAHDTIQVVGNPNIYFDTNKLKLCGGDTVELDFAYPIGGVYSGIFVNQNTNKLIAPYANITSTGGFYSLGDQCAFQKVPFLLDVSIFPSFNLGDDSQICVGQEMSIAGPEAEVYSWHDTSFSAEYNLSVEESDTGITTIWLKATDSLGCSGSDTLKVNIKPNPRLDLKSNYTYCWDSLLQISTQLSSSKFDFIWSDGSSENSLSLGNLPHEESEFEYSVQVFDTQMGCNVSHDFIVKTIDCDTNRFVLYPNPNRFDFIYLEMPKTWINDEVVLELNGSTGAFLQSYMWRTLYNGNKAIPIPISGLSPGLYFLRIRSGTKSKNLPFVII